MFYSDKKVLVTGATGLIGANLIQELVSRGAKVRGAVHKKKPLIKNKSVEYVRCELTRKKDCLAVAEGMDYVFHCAANSSGAVVMNANPIAHITENLLINSQMLEAAFAQKSKRFLFMSSSTVYPPSDQPMKENQAFEGDPYDTYFGVGWMKRYIEKLAEFYHRRYRMGIALIRPTNVYGAYDKFDPTTSHVLPALIRRAVEKNDPYEVWGDGTAVRDFIYVSDMVHAMLLALERAANCEPVNFASGKLVTIRQSVELILKLTGHDAAVSYDPSKPSTIPTRLLDLSRCRQVLAYDAQVSFEDGLRRTIDWYCSSLKS